MGRSAKEESERCFFVLVLLWLRPLGLFVICIFRLNLDESFVLLLSFCRLQDEDDLWDDLPADGSNTNDHVGGLQSKRDRQINSSTQWIPRLKAAIFRGESRF